jgi:hypothetical protein
LCTTNYYCAGELPFEYLEKSCIQSASHSLYSVLYIFDSIKSKLKVKAQMGSSFFFDLGYGPFGVPIHSKNSKITMVDFWSIMLYRNRSLASVDPDEIDRLWRRRQQLLLVATDHRDNINLVLLFKVFKNIPKLIVVYYYRGQSLV